MLKAIRNASNSLAVKILLGSIILSFCLWGVADLVTNYSASRAVIMVGKSEITVEQFAREYGSERQRIRNAGRFPLSDEEMENLDVDGKIIEAMVKRLTFEETLRILKIVVPKRTILEFVQSIPEFQKDGYFDEKIYERSLRTAGINEQNFIAQIRNNVERNQLFHPLVIGYKIPKFISSHIAKEFESQKSLVVAKIKISDMKADENPQESELRDYFNNVSEKYRTKEKRDISILVIDYKSIAGDIEVDEAEVERLYEESKDSYIRPESRDFERMAFEAEEDADKAWKMLIGGSKPHGISGKFSIKVDAIKGLNASDFAPAVGEELFKLKLNQPSSIIPIGGMYYIYYVSKINSSGQPDESSVKEKIREELRSEKINSPEFHDKVKEIKNRIDDGFGSGKSIDLIAQETGLKTIELQDFEKDADAKELVKTVEDADIRSQIVDAAFSTDEFQSSQNIDAGDIASYVVYVRHVEQSTLPTFEQVSDDVKKDYVKENKNKKASEKVQSIINCGMTAAEETGKLANSKRFRLSKKDIILYGKLKSPDVEAILQLIPDPNIVMNAISFLKKGEAVQFKISDDEYIIIAVSDIEKAGESNFSETIERFIERGAAGDVTTIAMDAFKNRISVKINHKLVEKMKSFGRGSEES
jgi:peptidyl-prolyl cis-trans isomerase D